MGTARSHGGNSAISSHCNCSLFAFSRSASYLVAVKRELMLCCFCFRWEFCHMMQKMIDDEAREIELKRQTMLIESTNSPRAKKSSAFKRASVLSTLAASGSGAVTREVVGKQFLESVSEDTPDLAATSKHRMDILNGKSESKDVLSQPGTRYERKISLVVPDTAEFQNMRASNKQMV